MYDKWFAHSLLCLVCWRNYPRVTTLGGFQADFPLTNVFLSRDTCSPGQRRTRETARGETSPKTDSEHAESKDNIYHNEPGPVRAGNTPGHCGYCWKYLSKTTPWVWHERVFSGWQCVPSQSLRSFLGLITSTQSRSVIRESTQRNTTSLFIIYYR